MQKSFIRLGGVTMYLVKYIVIQVQCKGKL